MNDVGLSGSAITNGLASMAFHVVLRIHESSLHPKAHPRVVLDAFAVEEVGQGAFDPVGEVEKLVLCGLVIRLFEDAWYAWSSLGKLSRWPPVRRKGGSR